MDLFYTKKKQNFDPSSASRFRSQERRMLFDLGELEDEMIGDEEDMEALMTLRILRNLSRERTIVPSGLNTIFAPIQPPPGGQQQNVQNPIIEQPNNNEGQDPVNLNPVQNENKEEKMEEEIPEEKNKIYLDTIIEKFEAILPGITEAELIFEKPMPKLPEKPLEQKDLPENYKVTVREQRTQLDQKFNKTNIFKERFSDIVEIVEPGFKWSIVEERK